MITIRKHWWAAILVTAFVGCTEEQPAGDNPPPPGNPGASAPKTTPTETPKVEPGKTDEKKDETKTEEKTSKEEPKLEAPAPGKEEPKKDEAKKDQQASKDKLTEDEIAEIQKLPAEERDLALKQVVCPVGGGHLGEMGKPVKVTAEGKTFFLCCASCNKEVKADPKGVVAKLNAK
jgi:hypothetical protein